MFMCINSSVLQEQLHMLKMFLYHLEFCGIKLSAYVMLTKIFPASSPHKQVTAEPWLQVSSPLTPQSTGV